MVTYVTDHGCTEVKVVFKSPEKITESGIIVDGQEQDFDAIICATGFECQYKPFLYACSCNASALPQGTNSTSELVGRDGTAIARDWEPVSTTTEIFDLKRQLNCALVATSLPRYTRSKVSELLHHQWSEKQLGSWLHTTNCDS